MSFVGGVGYSNIDLIYSGLDRLPDKGLIIFVIRKIWNYVSKNI